MTEQKTKFIEEIRPDDQFVSVFLCQQKDSFTGKTGLPYLSLKLGDKTGVADAKVWDNVESFTKLFDVDDYVKVKATATTYNGRLQLRISNIKRVPDSEVDPVDFLPTTPCSVEGLEKELRGFVEALENKHLRDLILSFLDDPDFMIMMRRAPAAKAIHHSYLGGLLEHVVSLAKLAKLVAGHYGDKIDLSLLMAGVFFHDLGKVRELAYDRSTGYTDEGRLIGHITIGIEIMNERMARFPDFPADLKMLLTHMILSHHGELEFGSPKRPKFMEAVVLSHIDDLDARVNSFSTILEEETQEQRWTGFQRIYNRYLYRWRDLPDDQQNAEASEAETDPEPKPQSTKTSRHKDEFFNNPIRFGADKDEEGNTEGDLLNWKDK